LFFRSNVPGFTKRDRLLRAVWGAVRTLFSQNRHCVLFCGTLGYGILATVRFLTQIHRYVNRTLNPQALRVVCDNKSMVRQVSKLRCEVDDSNAESIYGDADDTHPSLEPLQPEWDILQEIWHTINTWEHFYISHIKGHQDRSRPVHELSLHAQLNVEADALAGMYLTDLPWPKTEVLFFPHTHVQLTIKGQTITSRYSLRIRNAECDPHMITYLKKHYGWTDAVCESINWTVHGKAIRTQRHRKTHITKLVHDILPTNKIQHRWNSSHCPKCTYCSNEIETRDHLLRCPGTAEWRVTFMQNLRRKCEQLTTAPGLGQLLLHGIQAWTSGLEQVSDEGYGGKYAELIRSQNSIGWRHIFNGRWSIHWANIQGRFMGDNGCNGSSSIGNKWNVAVIQEVWEAWSLLWKARNVMVHGDDEVTRRAAEQAVVRQRMRAVYALQGRLEPVYARVLSTPIEEMMAKGIIVLKNWLAVYEERLHNSARRQRVSDLRGMRPLATYFGHIDDPG
jgi:hypothetical protein